MKTKARSARKEQCPLVGEVTMVWKHLSKELNEVRELSEHW